MSTKHSTNTGSLLCWPNVEFWRQHCQRHYIYMSDVRQLSTMLSHVKASHTSTLLWAVKPRPLNSLKPCIHHMYLIITLLAVWSCRHNWPEVRCNGHTWCALHCPLLTSGQCGSHEMKYQQTRTCVGLMLGQSRRRWRSIIPTHAQSLVFSRYVSLDG